MVGSGLLAIAAWSRVAEVYRARTLSRAAAALGFRFEPLAGRFINRGPANLALFRVGGGVGRNLVTDGRLTLFEHLTRANLDGLQPDGALVTVSAVACPGVAPFRLEFRRPGAFGTASSVDAARDEVDVDGPAAFTDVYRVFSDDPDAARALFHPDVVAFFAENPGWSVESNGAWLAAHRGVAHLDARRLAAQVDAHRRVVAQFVDARYSTQ